MVRKPANNKTESKALPEGEKETPLDYMLRVMRDPTCDAKRRDAMALKALPYCHRQLTSEGGKGGKEGEKEGQQGPTIRKFGEAIPGQSNNDHG
jgi:hypothetical protein